jgi:TonB family protein
MKRVPRLLLLALALSLLLHLIIALLLHPPSPTPQNQAEVVSIQHRPATIARRNPTPPPPPQRTPAPHASSSAAPVRNGPGRARPVRARVATPAPVVARATPKPAASATPACAGSEVAAYVVATPDPPQIPVGARAAGTSGTALIGVQLDASGQVTKTIVTQSTGNSSLDLVAVGMARDARYAPALHDCKPVASAYVFSVKFVAW